MLSGSEKKIEALQEKIEELQKELQRAQEEAIISSLTLVQILLFLKLVDYFDSPSTQEAYRRDQDDFELFKKFIEEIKKQDENKPTFLDLTFKLENLLSGKRDIGLTLTAYVKKVLRYSNALNKIRSPQSSSPTKANLSWELFINKVEKILLKNEIKDEDDLKKLPYEDIVLLYLQMMGQLIELGYSDYVEVTHQFIYMVKKSLKGQEVYCSVESRSNARAEIRARGMTIGGIFFDWHEFENQWDEVFFLKSPSKKNAIAKKFIAYHFAPSLIDLARYDKPFDPKIYSERQSSEELERFASEEEKEEKKPRLERRPSFSLAEQLRNFTISSKTSSSSVTPVSLSGEQSPHHQSKEVNFILEANSPRDRTIPPSSPRSSSESKRTRSPHPAFKFKKPS